ncbi:MAG: OsmC family protein [Candidatus Acidiferrales bacterium]
MNPEHRYRIRATSTSGRSGIALAESVELSIPFSSPPEFNGQAGHWTPEQFFISSVASCYVSTFSGMAFKSNLDFLSLHLDAEGTVGEDEGGWRFEEIVLRPRLTISHIGERTLANRLLHRAKEKCLVARSMACPVVLETAVIIGEEAAASN